MAIEFYGIELSDWVAMIALLASAIVPSVLYYFGRRRGTRSEQFRFSLQLWDRIDAQTDIIRRWNRSDLLAAEREGLNLEKALDSLKSQLKFFVFLTEKGEIKDKNVREYYREPLGVILINTIYLEKLYPDPGPTRGRIHGIINLIENTMS